VSVDPEIPSGAGEAAFVHSPLGESISTELGGVLFLIDAFTHLELLERLDDHFGITGAIGGWTWLEILGRALLGRGRNAEAGDPIWRALARLDARDGPLDLATFTDLRTVALPPAWPVPPAGVEAFGTIRVPGACASRAMRRLLSVLVPYLRWRLLESMALVLTAGDASAQLASRLLSKRGRLTYTSTHVDLHMGMNQVDIAVRMAGLDANPGWVPALGRVVTFYFDEDHA
jgi:hypothetical protein